VKAVSFYKETSFSPRVGGPFPPLSPVFPFAAVSAARVLPRSSCCSFFEFSFVAPPPTAPPIRRTFFRARDSIPPFFLRSVGPLFFFRSPGSYSLLVNVGISPFFF